MEEIAGSWAKELNCDFSSGPGSAGGPVVDLETGTVLGLHTSGKWDEQRGNITTAIRLVGFAEKASLPEWLRRELNPAVSIRTILPEGLTLRHPLETMAKTNDGTTNFKDPSAAELDELVKGGEMEAATAAALMESFSARFVNQQVRIQLKVVYQPETNVYEITIDR